VELKPDSIKFIKDNWYNWSGLVACEFIVIAAITIILKFVNVPNSVTVIINLVVFLILATVWFFTTRIPKTPDNKVGFAVCLSCSDDKVIQLIEEDFILNLKRLIASSTTGNTFHFIQVPRHFANCVSTVDEARKIMASMRCHFILYGRARERNIGGKQQKLIEMDGIVAHNPVSTTVTAALAAEFGELIPRRVTISQENEVFAFELTSEWTETASKYIIAVAASISGFVDYAESLFSEVQLKLPYLRGNIPAYTKLKERIPLRLLEIHEARARTAYERWFEHHDEIYLKILEDELNKVDANSNLPWVINLRSVIAFLVYRNVDEAIRLLKQCPRTNVDGVWHMNVAFLEAYKGNLRKSSQHYRNAINLNIYDETLQQVEDFIVYILFVEPERYHLYFCLGYINWKIKGDNIKAIEDYQSFLSQVKSDEYIKEAELARKWINDMSAKNLEL